MENISLVQKIAGRMLRKIIRRPSRLEVQSFSKSRFALKGLKLVAVDEAKADPFMRIVPKTLTKTKAREKEEIVLSCDIILDTKHELLLKDEKLKALLDDYLNNLRER